MKKIVLLLIFLSFGINSFSQSEAANWYFGYGGGIRFNQSSNTVTSLNDGQLFTNEGCASISDNNGNLLFYTDGTSVWNRNHVVMQNGSGLFGDSSSTQSAIIVPKPNDPDIYYVFTVDINNRQNGVKNGLNYSEIDITLDSGLGAVTVKKTNLLKQSSEKISAVLKDCNTKSIWVVTFSTEDGNVGSFNTFHAFEVNNLGVNPVSVKSPFNSLTINDARGYLKLSPDGTKIASANVQDSLFLYDFNTQTGIVSNQILLSTPANLYAYGIEFSPNSQLLYVHASNDFFSIGNEDQIPSNHTSSLIQYNLLDADINGSSIIIDNRNLYRGGLQLGPNGKIYRALSATYDVGLPYLGVINNPDTLGLECNYINNGINISPNLSAQGLPPFIASFFNTQIDIIKNGRSNTNLELCDGDIYNLTSEDILGATYTWKLNGNLLTETSYNLEVSTGGHYEVYIDPNNGDCAIEGQAYVTFNQNPQAFNTTILQCDEDGIKDGFTIFNLHEAHDNLTGGLQNISTKFYTDIARLNEITNSNSYSNTSNYQTIYVEVINDITGCTTNTELILNVSVTDSNNAQLITCDDDGIEDGFHVFNLRNADSDIVNGLPLGLTISYYETYKNALIEQNPLTTLFTNTNPYNQVLFARVENANNCYGISELHLKVDTLPEIAENDSIFYCLNTYPQTITINPNILNTSPNNYIYEWSTGETTFSIQVNEPKTYSVIITNSNNCSKEKTIIVEASNIATFESINVVDATQNNIITVLVSGEGTYEYSLLDSNNILYRPFQSSPIFENIFPGFYTVYVKDVKNNCGSVNTKVSVIGFPKYFTPNNDGVNDTWQVYGVSNMFQPNSKIFIFDRLGKLIKQLNPSEKGWDGTFNGKILPTDDYWFSVTLQDGRIFKSHFTLKN